MMAKSADAFTLRHEAAATPERVSAAALFVARLLKAVCPSLPEGSVTLVISNYSMGATVRARTAEGRKASDGILGFLDNPSKALLRDPDARKLAHALANPGDALLNAQIIRPRGRAPIATLDAQFAKQMAALASASGPEPVLRGTTVVFSPVYRIGRFDDENDSKIRVRINGGPHEVGIAEGVKEADFYEAVKAKRTFPVHLSAVWVRGADGTLSFDLKGTKAVRVDYDWAPITGEEFVAAMNRAAPSGFVDDDDLAERTERINQRRR